MAHAKEVSARQLDCLWPGSAEEATVGRRESVAEGTRSSPLSRADEHMSAAKRLLLQLVQ